METSRAPPARPCTEASRPTPDNQSQQPALRERVRRSLPVLAAARGVTVTPLHVEQLRRRAPRIHPTVRPPAEVRSGAVRPATRELRGGPRQQRRPIANEPERQERERTIGNGGPDHVIRESDATTTAAICPRSGSRYSIQSVMSCRRRSNRSLLAYAASVWSRTTCARAASTTSRG